MTPTPRLNARLLLAAALVSFAALPQIHAQNATTPITFLSGVTLPVGGEVVSFDSASGTILSTYSGTNSANVTVTHEIRSFTLGANGSLTAGFTVDLNTVFGNATSAASVSSVFADNRGFGVATIIPTNKTLTSNGTGRLVFFNTSNGSILNTLELGYHPDHVSRTPDGTKLLIANEGEYTTGENGTTARAGSVSVVDISSVASAANIAALSSANVITRDFSAPNLTGNASLTGVRDNTLTTNNATTTANPNNVEPEYITSTNDKAFITLQEGNAIAVLDFSSSNSTDWKFTNIHKLGTITKLIDASDREFSNSVGLAAINDTITGLPMPDTITSFTRNGTVYLATANEGDARPDDGDVARFASASIAPSTLSSLNATYSGLPRQGIAANGTLTSNGTSASAIATNALGRLNILTDQGKGGNGTIETPTALGTRSFTIWNSETGALVFDSASMIEEYVLANDIASFNINSGDTAAFDTRSDDKGPEPEGITFGSIDGRDYLFVIAERQNGIFQFDITSLASVSITGYFNTVTSTFDSGGAFVSPETIQFIAAGSNPTGQNLLLVGYEGITNDSGITTTQGSMAIYTVVPEPSTYVLFALAALGLGWHLRRKSRLQS